MARSAKRTIDHDEIKRWVAQRGGCPAHVKRTADADDPGILRIDFEGFSGQDTLGKIEWDEWFDAFEKNELAFIYQDEKDSRFSKLVRRNGADEEASGSGDQKQESGRRTGSGQSSAKSGMAGSAPRRWSSKTERVTINDANAEELDALWGVGPQNAKRIIEYRRQHGRLKGPEDLVAINGIDGALAKTIADQADFD
jgi:competence ComEA-like helix-hairpin-helix protein